jgi:protoheme IX farnesyltransferase
MSIDVMVAERVSTASRMPVGGVDASLLKPSSMVVTPATCAVIGAKVPGSIAKDETSVAVPSVMPSSSVARDLIELTKPRIVTMILVTTLIAAVVATGGATDAITLMHLLIGVAMVAGSAGAMNQVWERKIDGEMERTRRRPLPAGRMSTPMAASYSIILGLVGTSYLAYYLGWVPALVGLITWITYVPIYTPLKTRSSFNTTVGAVSGALPMMMGYTAAGGSLGDVRGWLLVGVLAAWQYPHFMAIAWLYRKQYDEAGFRMSTTVEPTGVSAGWQSVVGMIALIGCLIGLAVTAPDTTLTRTLVWTFCLTAVSMPMLRAAIRFAFDRNDFTARKLLRASLLQLPASLLLVMAAAILG